MRSTFIIVLIVLLGSPSARGQECPYVNFWFVIDVSSSIDEGEIAQAKAVIYGLVELHKKDIRDGTLIVGLSTFTSASSVVCDFSGIPDSIVAALDHVQARSGGTQIFHAVTSATGMFDVDESRFYNGRNVVFILSDGLDGSGNINIEQERGELEKHLPHMWYISIDISLPLSQEGLSMYMPYSRDSNLDVLAAYSTVSADSDTWQDVYDLFEEDDISALGAAFEALLSCQ